MNRVLLGLWAVMAVQTCPAQFPFTRALDVRTGQQRPAITVIAQDKDGMIWAGSDRGLLRLDGERVDVEINTGKARITALAASDTGMFVALSSGIILRFAANRCDTIYRDSLLHYTPVRAMAMDRNGALHLGTYGSGVLSITADGTSRLSTAQGLPDDHVNDLCVLSDGRVVVATDQGLALCSGDSVRRVFSELEGAPDNLVLTVSPTAEGGVWAGTDGAGAFLWDPDKAGMMDRIMPTASDGTVKRILVQGDLIWTTGRPKGALLFDRGERTRGYHLPEAMLSDGSPALDLLADRDGAVWWCDGSDRLYRADPAVLIIPEHEGVDLKHITALCIDHGQIWFATSAGLFSHPMAFMGGSLLNHFPLVVNTKTPIVSLDAAPDGTIWAATFGSGLFAVHPDGRIAHFDATHGGIDPNVLCVRTRGEEVWMATLTGMSKLIDGVVTAYGSPGTGFMFMALPLADGTVLGATDGSGVVRFDGEHLGKVSAAGPRTYYSIAQDSAGTAWAVGPGSGLCRLADTAMVCTDSGLPMFNGDLYALATMGRRVLVFSNSGCMVYDPRNGHWTDITARAGLGDLQAELNAVRHGPDGALWLACNKGLVRLRAADHWFSPALPTVITDVTIGNAHIPVRNAWNTTYDRNAVTFRYTAPYYADPAAVRFEIRLSGLNDKIVRTREREVSYPALSPGTYTFHVRAFLGEDADDAEWTSMRIQVDPPWWRLWWVNASALLLLGLIIIWAFRARERRVRYRQRMEQEQVRFQLEALRSQVDPHFLFNSFNTLVELIETEPAKAVEQVEELSTFFRNILQVRDRTFISLGEELRLVRTYFRLEQRRFGEAIDMDVYIPEIYMRMNVVPLTLQLLVENAIKHNVATMQHPVRITARVVDTVLLVSNTLRPRLSPARSTGFGLDSIRKRYAALSSRVVEVETTDDAFIVRIPLIASEP